MTPKDHILDISFKAFPYEQEIVNAFIETRFSIDPVIVSFPDSDFIDIHLYFAPHLKQWVLESLDEINDFLDPLENQPRREFLIQTIEKKDWLNEWQKYFYPILVENTIQITPVWQKINPEVPNLLLEPKMGFGTGQHATTYLCLKAMVDLYHSQKLKDLSVLDIGAGSGILGVATLLLGSKNATLLEIDEQSIESCYDTVNLNGVKDRCEIYHTDFKTEGIWHQNHYDLAFMNIIAEVIVEFLPLETIKRIPTLVLSGILDQKVDKVKNTLEKEGYTILKQENKKDWVMLLVSHSRFL